MMYAYLVFTFIFSWNICFGETTIYRTLCEHGPDLLLSCSPNEVISDLEITHSDYHCTTDDYYDDCDVNTNSLKSNCKNSSNCTISSTGTFSPIGKHKSPICIETRYTCDCFRGWHSIQYTVTTSACFGFLDQMQCSFGCQIASVNFNLKDTTVCILPKCFVTYDTVLNKLCKNRRKCINPNYEDDCFYQPKFVNIKYNCKGNSDSLSTETSSKPWSTSTSTQVKDTTINFLDSFTTYSSDVRSPVVILDVDGRVLIYSPSENQNETVCGIGWDNEDATVVCRYLYSSTQGQARWVSSNNYSNYETKPFAIHCTGNETDPFLCSYTYLDYGCNTSTVAAVACIKGTNSTNQSSRHNAHDSTSNNINVGVAVGVSVGVIVLIFIAVACFLLRKRSRLGKKDKLHSSKNPNGDYIGNQAIALPSSPHVSNHMQSYDDEDRHYRKNDLNPNNVASCNNFSSPAYVLNALEHGTIETVQVNGGYENDTSIGEEKQHSESDMYACSEEGVYDKAKNNRHVQTELNVYSHTIDTVYDTSDRNRNKEQTNETYDHFFGRKNDNNYDIAIRK